MFGEKSQRELRSPFKDEEAGSSKFKSDGHQQKATENRW